MTAALTCHTLDFSRLPIHNWLVLVSLVKYNCEQTKSERVNKISDSVLGDGLMSTSIEIPVDFLDSLVQCVLF